MAKFYERLDNIFARRKIYSFRKIRKFLQNHNVQINGKRIFTSGTKISLFTDEISIDDKKINLKNDIYILLNKAKNFICSTVESKDKNYQTVYSLLPQEFLNQTELPKLHTVGRLDVDTEGLLVFTTNGNLSHKLCSPDSHISKKYFVELKNCVCKEEQKLYTQKFAQGFKISHYGNEKSFISKPAILEFLSEKSCHLTISEGKFHQVKRMFLEFKNEVLYLKRIQMGNLKLDENLKVGNWRFLTEDEVSLLCLSDLK